MAEAPFLTGHSDECRSRAKLHIPCAQAGRAYESHFDQNSLILMANLWENFRLGGKKKWHGAASRGKEWPKAVPADLG